MDLEARSRWVDYSKAKDVCFAHTHTPKSPWFVVESDDKVMVRGRVLFVDMVSPRNARVSTAYRTC